MQFHMTKEWLVEKLAEMEAAGIDECSCVVGQDVFDNASMKRVRAKMRVNSINTSGSKEHPLRVIQLGRSTRMILRPRTELSPQPLPVRM